MCCFSLCGGPLQQRRAVMLRPGRSGVRLVFTRVGAGTARAPGLCWPHRARSHLEACLEVAWLRPWALLSSRLGTRGLADLAPGKLGWSFLLW